MTPTEAIDAVLAAVAPHWDRGTLKAEAVFEDSAGYAVSYGNAEYLDDGDLSHLILDIPLGFVDKKTGAVTFGPYLRNGRRVDAMTEVAV